MMHAASQNRKGVHWERGKGEERDSKEQDMGEASSFNLANSILLTGKCKGENGGSSCPPTRRILFKWTNDEKLGGPFWSIFNE